MRVKFLGAAGTVTGSSYVLTSNSGQSMLIDLGMFQGTEEVNSLNYQPYGYDTSKLLGAVLTHAHLDHCGRLPLLLKGGFKGNIWMTAPTADLTELSLMDSAKIAKEDLLHPLYDENLAVRTIAKFKTTDYHKPVTIGDFVVTFYDAGHILGSASLGIIDTSSHSDIQKIVFSGDLGNSPEYLVKQTEYLDSADVVVMESTYGDRNHPKDDQPKEVIRAEINAVEQSHTTLLIPAFSLERTQEILHIIRHLKEEGKVMKETPVYLDSPMAEKATVIYMEYPEDFNDHVRQEIRQQRAFTFPGLEIIHSHNASEQLRKNQGTQVIIAGSGMMTGGRIVGHAKHYLPLEGSRLLIVGYQGDETVGRSLLDGEREVTIDGEVVHVKATVRNTQGMSSHADQGQLMTWLANIKAVKKLFLTHGENEIRKVLADKIRKYLKIVDVTLPLLNQEIEL